MKNNIYVILATIAGYSLAPIILGIFSEEFGSNLNDILLVIFASPYCMIRYLIAGYKFFPAWEVITTYLGAVILLSSLWYKPSDTTALRTKLLVAFIGAFIWNLGFHESGRLFLTA